MALSLNRRAAIKFYQDLANDIRENDQPSKVELTGALESAAHRVEEDGKRIKSLQRENEELRRERDEWHEGSKDDYKTIRRLEEELDLARAAIITPEMREKIERALEIGPGNDPKFSERVFRDLLGEQG